MEALKIGFIGLGDHQTRAHLRHLKELANSEDFELQFMGAFDPSDESFYIAEETLGQSITKFESVQKLIGSGIEAVFIGSPNKFHSEHLQAAVEQKLHIFCAKPMAVNMAEIEILKKVISQCRINNKVLSTCHPRRKDPPFTALKEELPTLCKKYGKVLHFDFSFWYQEVLDIQKKDRSLLSNHVGHEIDLFCYLFGSGNLNAVKHNDNDKMYEVIGQKENGPSFRFFGSRALVEPAYKETVRIDFEKGSMIYCANNGLGVSIPDMYPISFPKMNYDSKFLEVNENFLDTILGRKSLYLTDNDILRNNQMSVELTETGLAVWQDIK